VARILITGAAGFIGYHTSLRLFSNPSLDITAIDSLNPMFPTHLTAIRQSKLKDIGIRSTIINLATETPLGLLNKIGEVEIVVHLAAFPGVRLSQAQEVQVRENNNNSFENVLEYCRIANAQFLYASSSSIYGDQGLDGPCKEISASIYSGKGAYSKSKWENERRAIELFNSNSLASLGLRFFSVFGTYGRRDMAYYKFADQISNGEPLTIFDSLNDKRDYTPIEYIVDDIEHLISKILIDSGYIRNTVCDYDNSPILNIGAGQPKSLNELISIYEKYFEKSVRIINQPRKSMESKQTWSNNDKRNFLLPSRQVLEFSDMINKFAEWHALSGDS
jgi:UDP-glucuronate 4-epimerase